MQMQGRKICCHVSQVTVSSHHLILYAEYAFWFEKKTGQRSRFDFFLFMHLWLHYYIEINA